MTLEKFQTIIRKDIALVDFSLGCAPPDSGKDHPFPEEPVY
ncbi:MAG: hypothetical protein R2860_13380 [Desulfobacterales bacterium]